MPLKRIGDGWVAVGLLALVYILINMVLPDLNLEAEINGYVVQPLLWAVVAVIALLTLDSAPGVKGQTGRFVKLAVIIGAVQIAFLCLGGLFSGFGNTPSDLTLPGILKTLLYLVCLLLGMEFSRFWIIRSMGNDRPFLAVALSALLLTLVSQPLSRLVGIPFGPGFVPEFSSTWAPALGENLLASMLCYLAGPWASLGYRGLLAFFWWFCPVLPDLPWTLKAMVGLTVPLLGISFINYFYLPEKDGKPKESSFPARGVVVGFLCVLIIWFGAGALPFQPVLVSSGSMEPAYNPGDIAIVAKVSADAINPGDVIEYRSADDKTSIVHRVKGVEGTGNETTFLTQGDQNNVPDTERVPYKNVTGKLIFNIPKLGWASVFLKSFIGG